MVNVLECKEIAVIKSPFMQTILLGCETISVRCGAAGACSVNLSYFFICFCVCIYSLWTYCMLQFAVIQYFVIYHYQ